LSGSSYELPENDLGILSLALDFASGSAALVVRAAAGETRTPIGLGSWTRSREGFANGLEKALGVPAHPAVAASGAWTADDVFTVELALCETPFHSMLTFRFEGDRLVLDSEHNVSFGPTKLPRLVGEAAREPARSR
jgi:hypothetical protein